MKNASRKISFVLAACDHGTMIVSRLDYRMVDENKGFGVGFDILERSSFAPREVDLAISLLELRRKYFGNGVVAVDCGANIGVHTIEWAKKMTDWGRVIAIEAQERIFYALAGNIAINNCFNAKAILGAVSSNDGVMNVPTLDYSVPSSFGSLELKQREHTEFIGQHIDYSNEKTTEVQSIRLDSLKFNRIDLIKIDVEGMEIDVLDGAIASVREYHPILIVESIKSNNLALRTWLENLGYSVFPAGLNLLAVHKNDKALDHVRVDPIGS